MKLSKNLPTTLYKKNIQPSQQITNNSFKKKVKNDCYWCVPY